VLSDAPCALVQHLGEWYEGIRGMSNKKVSVTVNLPEELIQFLDSDAKIQRRSRSNLIVGMIEEHYEVKINANKTGTLFDKRTA
jgi:hypothetical protein